MRVEITGIHKDDAFYKHRKKYIGMIGDVNPLDIGDLDANGWRDFGFKPIDGLGDFYFYKAKYESLSTQ